jgi:1-acyl-sn-glycerol-3-phosphate acyltransferase
MALHKVGSYAVDRGANDVGAVKKTLTLLKEGRVVGIFRKGTGARRGSA